MSPREAVAPLLETERLDWNTPPIVIDLVRQFAGERIGCDPCSNPGSYVNARVQYCEADNGLAASWESVTYCNPPYGRSIGEWVEKAHREFVASDVETLMLLPAKPDTQWFHKGVMRATSICFWMGRIKFLGAEGPAPFPSMVVYFGERSRRFQSIFEMVGKVVKL